MDASSLTISIGYDGPICVLSAVGDLDTTTVGRFQRCALAALADLPERLVFDLVGLSFLDCAGARALESVVRAVPDGCPVVVRALSPVARRLLGLLDVNLEHVPRAPRPSCQALGRQQQIEACDRLRQVAEALANTGEKVAATFAREASQRPDRAAQLSAVSQSAYDFAVRARCWASAPHHQQQLMSLAAVPRSSEDGSKIGTGLGIAAPKAALPSSNDTDVHDLLAVRAVIEQAKGILMATYRCGTDEAFDLLHKTSQGLGVKVHVLAARVVDLAAHGAGS